MPKPLDDCRSTLARIDRKLDDLKGSVGDYHVNSCGLRQDDDLQKGERVYRLTNVKQPPVDLTMDVAEIADLMRPTLDHLMFALVSIAHGGTITNPKVIRDCHFPILAVPGAVKRPVSYNLTPTQWNWIDSLQITSAGNPQNFPLIILNALSNVRKHRLYNALVTINSQTLASIAGVGGLRPGMTFANNIINDRVYASVEAFEADFVDDAPVFKVIPGKVPANLIKMRDRIDIFDTVRRSELNAQLTSSISSGNRWTHVKWMQFFRDFDPKIQLSQQILFGPGDPVTQGLPVIDTLQAIRNYLYNDVFADRGVIAGL